MVRDNYLFGEERPLPYLVQLVRIDGAPLNSRAVAPSSVLPALMHLDLRGGEFTRPTIYRLSKTFDWLTRAYDIDYRKVDEYALAITPLPPRTDEEITNGRTPYVPEDWPDQQKRSFLWVPVAFDEPEEKYAWQR